ncbi:MAG: ABC transporter substrate-binding protein [Dietzia sp.]
MNPLTRRGFLGVLGAATAATTLTACAGTGSDSGTDGGTGGGASGGGDTGTITFWSNHPGTSKELEQEIIDAFEAENPDLKVNLVDGGSNYEEVAQKFNAALTGGDLPDVVVLSDVTWFNFALNGQITPLGDLFTEAGVDTGDFVDALLGDYVLEGENYGVPFARSTPLFYYNKEVWQAAGLPDRGPENWTEFAEWAPRLQDAIGDGKHAIAMYDGSNYIDWTAQNIVWDFDGAFSRDWDPTFTEDGTIRGVEYVTQLNDDGFLVVSADSIVEFGSGLAACALASTGSLAAAKTNANFEFGTAFLPGAAEMNSCPTGGAGVAIPAGISDERKLNAMKFIDFLTNTQSTARFAQGTGYMPVRKSAREAEEIKAYLAETPQAATAIDQLAHTRPQDNARVLVPNGGRRIGGAFDRVLGGADVRQAMQQVQDETAQIIDSQIRPKLDG